MQRTRAGRRARPVVRAEQRVAQAPRAVVVAGVSLIALVLLAAFARTIVASEQAGRASLEERAVQRTVIAERFIEAYDADLLADMESHARVALAGPDPSADDLALVTEMMRFRTAELLDDQGRVLQTDPSDASLLGAELGDRYDHLDRAVAGEPTVTGVIPSPVGGEPIVAFAVPFDGPDGRRVFSAGYRAEDTPLGAYLLNATVLPGEVLYLVDESGAVIASSDPEVAPTLEAEDPAVATASAGGDQGTYEADGVDRFFSARTVEGTPWRLVRTVPSDAVYAPTEEGRWIPWILFGGFFFVGFAGIVMFSSIIGQRDREHLRARRDALTGVANRRSLDAELAELRTGDRAWSVLMIDVDHFKQVNDEHGHRRGDEVLAGVAAAIADSVRVGDVVGRWGGEEFVVLVADGDPATAADLAERIRASVAAQPIAGVAVTVSIGYASSDLAPGDGLVDLADASLYRAKQDGRNRTVALTPAAAFPAATAEPIDGQPLR